MREGVEHAAVEGVVAAGKGVQPLVQAQALPLFQQPVDPVGEGQRALFLQLELLLHDDHVGAGARVLEGVAQRVELARKLQGGAHREEEVDREQGGQRRGEPDEHHKG